MRSYPPRNGKPAAAVPGSRSLPPEQWRGARPPKPWRRRVRVIQAPSCQTLTLPVAVATGPLPLPLRSTGEGWFTLRRQRCPAGAGLRQVQPPAGEQLAERAGVDGLFQDRNGGEAPVDIGGVVAGDED